MTNVKVLDSVLACGFCVRHTFQRRGGRRKGSPGRTLEQHILLAVSRILFDINLSMVGWSVPQTENILMDGKLGSEVGKEKND